MTAITAGGLTTDIPSSLPFVPHFTLYFSFLLLLPNMCFCAMIGRNSRSDTAVPARGQEVLYPGTPSTLQTMQHATGEPNVYFRESAE